MTESVAHMTRSTASTANRPVWVNGYTPRYVFAMNSATGSWVRLRKPIGPSEALNGVGEVCSGTLVAYYVDLEDFWV